MTPCPAHLISGDCGACRLDAEIARLQSIVAGLPAPSAEPEAGDA